MAQHNHLIFISLSCIPLCDVLKLNLKLVSEYPHSSKQELPKKKKIFNNNFIKETSFFYVVKWINYCQKKLDSRFSNFTRHTRNKNKEKLKASLF